MLQAQFLLTRSTLFAILGGNFAHHTEISIPNCFNVCVIGEAYDAGVLENTNHHEG